MSFEEPEARFFRGLDLFELVKLQKLFPAKSLYRGDYNHFDYLSLRSIFFAHSGLKIEQVVQQDLVKAQIHRTQNFRIQNKPDLT